MKKIATSFFGGMAFTLITQFGLQYVVYQLTGGRFRIDNFFGYLFPGDVGLSLIAYLFLCALVFVVYWFLTQYSQKEKGQFPMLALFAFLVGAAIPPVLFLVLAGYVLSHMSFPS